MIHIEKQENKSELWLSSILSCVKTAYEAIKGIIGTEKAREKIKKGAGGDTTLLIDKIAEDKIIENLRSLGVPYKLITEECGEIIFMEEEYKKGSKDYIIVDPIDGSANAAWGFPFSCISIAHAFGNRPYLTDVDCGAVIDIFTGDIYYARKGFGAYKNKEIISGNENTEIKKCFFGINLSLDESLLDFIQRYSFIFKTPLKVRSMGSDGLSLCILAAGGLDTFFNIRKKTRILDIAAGYLIALEAGCEIWDLEGNQLNAPLELNSRVSFLGINKGLAKYFKKFLPQFSKAFKLQPEYDEK